VGQEQDAFVDAFGAKVLPQLRAGDEGRVSIDRAPAREERSEPAIDHRGLS